MNTRLSEYSLNNNYLKRTEGKSVPLKYNSKTPEELEIEKLIEEKLQKRLGNMQINNQNNQNNKQNQHSAIFCDKNCKKFN